MRTFLGIVAGIVAAFAVQIGIDVLTNKLYPVAISDMWDRAQVTQAMASRPTPALLLTVLGFFLGALAGGYVARRLSGVGWTVWVPAGVLAAMALIISVAYPVPAWTWFATLAAPLIGGMIAGHLGPRATAPATEASDDADL
ncbi:MAG: hypothetical protein KF780_03470 [Sphingomonas sp.]|nr:hypothetical protein [Sphingomonas sp.]